MTLKGTRVEDHASFWDGGPGTYMRVSVKEHEERFITWFCKCPSCGRHFHLAHNPRYGEVHEPEETPEGLLTVRPRPHNSNSIKCPACGWHGYIYEGVWTEA